jgi:hypothetical protein
VQRDYLEEDGNGISTIVRSTPSMTIGNPLFGTHYNTWGSIHDDESLASFLIVANHMQLAQFTRNKVQFHNTPKQRPRMSKKDGLSIAKKCMSFPISKDLINNFGPLMCPFKPTTYPQHGVNSKGALGFIKSNQYLVPSLGGNDNNLGDGTMSGNGHSMSKPYKY